MFANLCSYQQQEVEQGNYNKWTKYLNFHGLNDAEREEEISVRRGTRGVLLLIQGLVVELADAYNYRNTIGKREERTGNRLGASGASLGEELAEAVGAVRLVVARRESLTCQRVVAVAAGEAVSVPRLVLVRHAAAGDDLRQNFVKRELD